MHSLPDVNDYSFEMYVEWLYHARILATPAGEGDCYLELIDAYAVGMRFENEDFCNAILHAIVEVIEDDDDYPSEEAVRMAYDKTNGHCGLRDLLVSVYMKLCPGQEDLEFDDLWEDLPTLFLRDLFMAFMESAPGVEDRTETTEALRSGLPPPVLSDVRKTGY